MIREPLRKHYVYVGFRPNGIPCYVGKGKGKRWMFHEKARDHYNLHLACIIKKAGGSIPIVIVRKRLTEIEAFETEIALIKAIGRADLGLGPLVNLTDGGDGQFNLAEESRKKISDSHKAANRPASFYRNIGAKRKNYSHSEETKSKMSAAATGRKRAPFSDEWKQKISLSMKGRPAPWLKGKPILESQRLALSKAHKGRKQSPEQIRKRIAATIATKAAKKAAGLAD